MAVQTRSARRMQKRASSPEVVINVPARVPRLVPSASPPHQPPRRSNILRGRSPSPQPLASSPARSSKLASNVAVHHLTASADQYRASPSSGQTSLFFTLPIELRLQIYEYVVLDEHEPVETVEPVRRGRPYGFPGAELERVRCPHRLNISRSWQYAAPVSPSISRTCRAIRGESVPVFLKNEFFVDVRAFDLRRLNGWFELFSDFDTSKVDVRINWCSSFVTRRPQDQEHASIRKNNILTIMQAGLEGRSHIFPLRDNREWTFHYHVRYEYRGTFYRPVSRRAARSANEGFVAFAQFGRLAEEVEGMRVRGVSWSQIEGMMELAVDMLLLPGEYGLDDD